MPYGIPFSTILVAVLASCALLVVLGILYPYLKSAYTSINEGITKAHDSAQNVASKGMGMLDAGLGGLFRRYEPPEGSEMSRYSPTIAETLIFSAFLSAFWIVATVADVLITRERFGGLLGIETNLAGDILSLIGAAVFVATLGIWGLLWHDLIRPVGCTVLFPGLDGKSQQLLRRLMVVGAAATIAAGVLFGIASYQSSVGIEDTYTDALFWVVLLLSAYGALVVGALGLTHLGRIVVAAALLLLAIPLWLGKALFWLVSALLQTALFILRFIFVDVLGNLGNWIWRRATGKAMHNDEEEQTGAATSGLAERGRPDERTRRYRVPDRPQATQEWQVNGASGHRSPEGRWRVRAGVTRKRLETVNRETGDAASASPEH
jgi:hypothetical protein